MTTPPPAARDPATPRRLTLLVLTAVLAWPLLRASQFRPSMLFDPDNLRVMGGFLAGFLPPSTAPDFLPALARATVDTLAIATAGLAIAFVLATPMALLTTRTLSISALGPAPGAWRNQAVRHLLRALGALLRAVPEVVWALMFVRVMGLGPAAGVLALGLTYGGLLAKVYAEILDSTDPRPAQALMAAGSGRLGALCFGLLPLAAQELVSYTIYRWECAVRASVVMGFVGAGGLGQLLDQSLKMLVGGEVSSIALVFLLLVTLADGLSAGLRKVLA